MGLRKLTAKIADYNERLESGKANKIKPDHVRKVLEKLRAKESSLAAEIAETGDADRRARLELKLGVAREHITRAEWLLKEIARYAT